MAWMLPSVPVRQQALLVLLEKERRWQWACQCCVSVVSLHRTLSRPKTQSPIADIVKHTQHTVLRMLDQMFHSMHTAWCSAVYTPEGVPQYTHQRVFHSMHTRGCSTVCTPEVFHSVHSGGCSTVCTPEGVPQYTHCRVFHSIYTATCSAVYTLQGVLQYIQHKLFHSI